MSCLHSGKRQKKTRVILTMIGPIRMFETRCQECGQTIEADGEATITLPSSEVRENENG